MSSAAADAALAPPAGKPRRGLSKKLLIIVLAVLLVLALAGGAAVVLLKKRAAAAAAADAEDGAEPAAAHVAERPKSPPTFLALEPFTVNLADKDAERFAQVGVSFELADAHAEAEIKGYMPSIRNAVLLILAHKTSAELLGRPGKEQLAREIAREATRAMGYAVAAEAAAASAADGESHDADADAEEPRAKKKAAKAAKAHAEPEAGPIRRVVFSNFIIQ